MAIQDQLMPHYFEWATEMPLGEVRTILDALARKELHPREAKRTLARRITGELHSSAAAEEAERAFDRLHKEGAAPTDIDVITVDRDGAKEVPIVELIVQAGLEKSKRAARTLVEQGAVRVDRERATLETRVPTSGELLMQLGPRRFARIRFR